MPKIYLTKEQKERERLQGNMMLAKQSRKLSDEVIAKETGVSPVTLRNRYRDPKKMTIYELEAFCRITKVDVAKFLFEKLEIR